MPILWLVKKNSIDTSNNQFRHSKCRSNSNISSGKCKHSDDSFKCFIGYKKNNIVKSLCIISNQGYIKYFENGGRNISLMIRDQSVLIKYNKIWNNIKKTLNIKFHSMPVYDQKYIKSKVREFNSVIQTNFLDDQVPGEAVHYACIACTTVDSVLRMEKKNYPQVYLEQCKNKLKKTKMSKFINTELVSELEL